MWTAALDSSTHAGRENRDTVRQIVDKTMAVARQMAASQRPASEIDGYIAAMRDRLMRVGAQVGFDADELQNLLTKEPLHMPDYKARARALLRPDRSPIVAELPNVNGDDKTAVIRIYDPIDSWGDIWGVSAKEFVSVLDELPDSIETIRLLINSPGGEVSESVAILNALRSSKARVVAVVEGLAASAASVLACGADELIMQPNSDLMIHDAWGMCVGNADDMRGMADMLDHFSNNIASIYAAKAGGNVETWRAAMSAETWYSAQEAVDAGLADSVGDKPADPKAKARFDLSIFNFSGRGNAPGPQEPAIHGGPSSNPAERTPAVAFSDEQLTHLRGALDLSDDADETAIFDALDSKLKEYVEQPAPTPAPTAPTLPEGVVAIDSTTLDQLKADAQAGRDARAEQVKAHREQVVNAAVATGRIAPARAEHWLAQLEADPGAEQVLASLPAGLIPVDGPKGTNGATDLDADDAIYAELFGTEVKA